MRQAGESKRGDDGDEKHEPRIRLLQQADLHRTHSPGTSSPDRREYATQDEGDNRTDRSAQEEAGDRQYSSHRGKDRSLARDQDIPLLGGFSNAPFCQFLGLLSRSAVSAIESPR